MSYLRESFVRSLGEQEALRRSSPIGVRKSASTVLKEELAKAIRDEDTFDIFLSHSIKDADLVLGAKKYLEGLGKTVYVDWIVDPNLDRSKVSPATAESLRNRMSQCESLLYLYSRNSQTSRWMTWELGFFDGYNGNVAILPLLPTVGELTFPKEEFVGLYPTVDFAPPKSGGGDRMWVNQKPENLTESYVQFGTWLRSEDKLHPIRTV